MTPTSPQERSIGIFDSGIGGLTVMAKVIEKLPNENIIYFGDTARVPYGGKSGETILRYSVENSLFLSSLDIKLLVIACNTATAFALEHLQSLLPIPVIGVIAPGAEKAVQTTTNQRIAVLGTKATIRSGAYQKEIQKSLPRAIIHAMACPLFVPLAEECYWTHPATKAIVHEYLHGLNSHDIDTVLLGCTHYPLLRKLIQEEVGDQVTLVDSASTCAEKIQEVLLAQNLQTSLSRPPRYQYFVSDDPERFRDLGCSFLGLPINEVGRMKDEGGKRKTE